MDKVSPVAKPQCFEGSFPLPSSGCHLVGLFSCLPYKWFSAPTVCQQPSSVTSSLPLCPFWVIWTPVIP